MKLWDWIKSFARILKSNDLQQYTCEDLEGIIVAGATENPLAAKDTIIKTVNNILLLPNAFFWDRMYRFLFLRIKSRWLINLKQIAITMHVLSKSRLT